jgi:predicted ATPase
LATYRTSEAEGLTEWQRGLSRAGQAANIRLTGLSEPAVAELLTQAGADQATGHPLAARVHEATGGNAFFVLETVRELLESGQSFNHLIDLPLPATVRDAVLRRVARLTPLAQQIVTVAAVLSPHLRVETLVETSGRGELETLESVEELLTHQLLQADGHAFRFHHDLARQAVYEDISPWRQRLLHRRAAESLTGIAAPEEAGLPATIADHFEKAGEKGRAIDYYRQAAQAAQRLYAHQEALAYGFRAIVLSEQVQQDSVMVAQLHESLADSLIFAGQFAAAEADYQLSLGRTPLEDRLWRAELYRKLAGTLSPQHRYQEAVVMYKRAL